MQRSVGSRVCQIVQRIVASVRFYTVTSLASSSEFATVTPSRQGEHGSWFRAAGPMFRSFHSTMSDNMESDLGDSYVWPNKPAAPNPAIASRLQCGRQWRGVGEPGRSAFGADAS